MVKPTKVLFADTLRGVAAILVLASHHWLLFWTDPTTVSRFTGLEPLPISDPPLIAHFLGNIISPLNPGPIGVGVFFLVSGFVIPFAFERQSKLGFAAGRVFRLWPTYLAGFFITVSTVTIASALYQTTLPFSGREVLIHSFLGLRAALQSKSIDGIVWSLEVEIIFYATALLIAQSLSKGQLRAFIIPFIALLSVLALKVAVQLMGESWIASKLMKPASFAPHLIFIYVGVVLNFWHRNCVTKGRAVTISIILLLAAGSAVALSGGAVDHLAINYLAALGIFLVLMNIPIENVNNRFFLFFSKISYPLYVVHGVTGYVLLYALVSANIVEAPIAIVLVFGIVIGLACLLHFFIERPSHALGQQLSSWLSRTHMKEQSK